MVSLVPRKKRRIDAAQHPMIRISKRALFLMMLSGGVIIAAGSSPAAPAQTWRIEMVSEVCRKEGLFAAGNIEVDALGLANGKLTIYDGSKASFVAKLDRQNQISVHFLSEGSEAFELKGGFSKTKEQGTWKSGTLSCEGKWQAERLEK